MCSLFAPFLLTHARRDYALGAVLMQYSLGPWQGIWNYMIANGNLQMNKSIENIFCKLHYME